MNHLYCGDNLSVLRDSIRDESVDLVYLDPPFNSNASYNVLFKGPTGSESAAQIEAFDDIWHWNDSAEAAFGDVMRGGTAASRMLQRTELRGRNAASHRAAVVGLRPRSPCRSVAVNYAYHHPTANAVR
jgi:hypothetical protein